MDANNNWDWMTKRQQQYDFRVAQNVIGDRTSIEALDLHNRIVAEIDLLPKSGGGRG